MSGIKLSNRKIKRTNEAVFFDCDDTLVFWGAARTPELERVGLDFNDPYRAGISYFLIPNDTVIRKLKNYALQGHEVYVWSAGGKIWAEEVVRVLGIGEFVHHVMSKPAYYYDDVKHDDWMGFWERVYPKFG